MFVIKHKIVNMCKVFCKNFCILSNVYYIVHILDIFLIINSGVAIKVKTVPKTLKSVYNKCKIKCINNMHTTIYSRRLLICTTCLQAFCRLQIMYI